MSMRSPFTLIAAGLLLACGQFAMPTRAHAVPSCEIDADCDDGLTCTDDVCVQGACVHPGVECDDFDACTGDSCEEGVGCVFPAIDCDDANACTLDACDPQAGCTYDALNCDDVNACTEDACVPELGCTYAEVVCEDYNACTDESCDAELGCQHTAISCDDDNECTIDSCNGEVGCAHEPIPGSPCDPGGGGTAVAGSRLRVDDVGDPRGKRNAATLTDTAISLAGVDPTVSGATAEIGQPGGPSTVITLAADGWSKAGSGAIAGWKYKSRSEGVLAARLRDGKSIRFSARASGIYGLNGQPQGELGVIFRVGSAKYCAIFGGTIRRDDGQHFVAVRAPAPQACPIFNNQQP